MKRQAFKGEITVFLSLIFLLLLSLAGGLIQSASIYITKSMKRADTQLALESVFAEYYKEAFEQYDLFVKKGAGEFEISERLWFYGAKNIEHSIEKIRLLSDEGGLELYRQILLAMGGTPKYGEEGEVGEEDLTESEVNDLDLELEEEREKVTGDLDDMLEEEEESLSDQDNPIESVGQLKKIGLLSLVYPDGDTLSDRAVTIEGLASHRNLTKGTGYGSRNLQTGVWQKALLTAYVLEHFPDQEKEGEGDTLFYQQEYLLGGKGSDRENLEVVAKKLLAIRMGANYAYLLSSQARQAEAEVLAVGLCALLTVPGASVLVKHAILLSWAYGESILDLRALFTGKKVPLIKTDETWQSQLANLTKLGTADEVSEQKEFSEGMTYGDYMKILLYAEKEETLCMRILDLLELNLDIRTDECVTALEIKSSCQLQRGITDTFRTGFQYETK